MSDGNLSGALHIGKDAVKVGSADEGSGFGQHANQRYAVTLGVNHFYSLSL